MRIQRCDLFLGPADSFCFLLGPKWITSIQKLLLRFYSSRLSIFIFIVRVNTVYTSFLTRTDVNTNGHKHTHPGKHVYSGGMGPLKIR